MDTLVSDDDNEVKQKVALVTGFEWKDISTYMGQGAFFTSEFEMQGAATDTSNILEIFQL